MALIVDTRTLDTAGDRVEALRAAFAATVAPTRMEFAADAHGTLSAWSLTSGLSLVHLDLTASTLKLGRTPASRLRESAPERFSFAVNSDGFCLTDSCAVRTTDNSRVRVVDFTERYRIAYRGDCRTVAAEIDCDFLGVDVDQVHRTSHRVPHSVLHRLVRSHLLELSRAADDLSPTAVVSVAVATAGLFRALVQSVSPRAHDRREAMAATLTQRIDAYVRAHLGEPELTPARIAVEHNISLRYLYVLLSERAETPQQWIIKLRLAAAREDLARGPSTVSAVAARWGFRDHSHFTRRFKAEYGLTPVEFMNR